MKIAQHEELQEWQEKHGVTLQLGLMVRLTDEGKLRDFPPEGEQFMVAGLGFTPGGVMARLNTHGEHDDYVVAYMLRLDNIEPVPGDS